MSTTQAIVIASQTADQAFAALAPAREKSLVSLNGRPAISHTVDALKQCDGISGVIVVGCQPVLDAVPNADVRAEARSTEAESVIAGVRAADGADRCLILTGDMPLAQPDAVSDLLTNAPDVDIVYPIVKQGDAFEVFPQRKLSYLKTKEGQVTGSSCLLVRQHSALTKERTLVDLLEARRNPSVLLGIVGVGLGLRMVFSTLSLTEFERSLSDALRLDCRVFITHYPELLFSIDAPEDIGVAEAHLRQVS